MALSLLLFNKSHTMQRNYYSQEELQFIKDNYDDQKTMMQNAEELSQVLENRGAHALQVKISSLKRKGFFGEIVKQESKIEETFQSRLVDLIVDHMSPELKEKLFIAIISKI